MRYITVEVSAVLITATTKQYQVVDTLYPVNPNAVAVCATKANADWVTAQLNANPIP